MSLQARAVVGVAALGGRVVGRGALVDRAGTAGTVAAGRGDPGGRTVTRMAGYFSSDGVAWRVGRELALMLGGGRALLLQVAIRSSRPA